MSRTTVRPLKECYVKDNTLRSQKKPNNIQNLHVLQFAQTTVASPLPFLKAKVINISTLHDLYQTTEAAGANTGTVHLRPKATRKVRSGKRNFYVSKGLI